MQINTRELSGSFLRRQQQTTTTTAATMIRTTPTATPTATGTTGNVVPPGGEGDEDKLPSPGIHANKHYGIDRLAVKYNSID